MYRVCCLLAWLDYPLSSFLSFWIFFFFHLNKLLDVWIFYIMNFGCIFHILRTERHLLTMNNLLLIQCGFWSLFLAYPILFMLCFYLRQFLESFFRLCLCLFCLLFHYISLSFTIYPLQYFNSILVFVPRGNKKCIRWLPEQAWFFIDKLRWWLVYGRRVKGAKYYYY